jgi:hypothetical protein
LYEFVEMRLLKKYAIPVGQKYLVGCVDTVLIFCWFNLYLIFESNVAQVDIEIEVSQEGVLRIYWLQNGVFSEQQLVKKQLTPTQKHYSLRVPCRGYDINDIFLMIAPIDLPGTVRLQKIDIDIPFFKKTTVDIPAHFKDPTDFSDIADIQLLPEGGVEFTASSKNPIFFIREEVQQPLPLPTFIIITLCCCMWIIFHPILLKGSRKGGHLIFEICDNDWQLVSDAIDEIRDCCRDLVLDKSSVAENRHFYYFSFNEIDEVKFAAVRSLLINNGSKFTLRMQMNRSGEL